MRKYNLAKVLLAVLPLSTLVVACDKEGDTDARAALEKEALERELDLALQPDTTMQPELEDVPLEQPEVAEAPPSAAPQPSPAPRRTPQPQRVTPRRSAPAPTPAPQPSRPRFVTLSAPAGTSFAVRLNEEVSTRNHSVGESFTATLAEPIVASNGTVMIPAGATVRGQVTDSRKSGRAGENAAIGITFTSISYDGRTYPIDSSASNVPSKLVTRDSNLNKAAKIGGGAAAGAVIGRVIGRSTKSTIAGAAIGAAAGTAVAMGTADVDRVIPAGSQVTVRLDGPVRVEKEVG